MARSAKLGSRGAANVSSVMLFAFNLDLSRINEVAAFGYPRERWFE
ncbi:MAG: hypothetical protein WDN50_10810 [Bradyrhizobium sp.]